MKLLRRLVWKFYNYRAATEFALGYRPERVLFNHVPKCAGTSVNRYLFSQYPHSHIFHIDTGNAHRSLQEFSDLPQSARYDFRLISGHYAHCLRPLVHPETICFTILREPVDRIVSLYHFILQSPEHYLHEKVAGSRMTLEEFATGRISPELRNWYTSHLTGLSSDEIALRPEKSLTLALQTLEEYSVVGFFDAIPSSLRRLQRLARFKRQYHERQINRTHFRKKVSEISASALNRICNENAVDIRLYSRAYECRTGNM